MSALLVVPGEPRPKGRPRFGKNRKPYTPAATAAHEDMLKWEFKKQKAVRRYGPLRVTLRFYLGNARRVDGDNLAKCVLDAANKTLWLDDSQIVSLLIEKHIDREHPRTEILVEALVEAAA